MIPALLVEKPWLSYNAFLVGNHMLSAHKTCSLLIFFPVASYNPSSSVSILQSCNMAGAILEIVLENLNSLELGLCLGFNLDMKRFASLLTTIKETLEDAEQKQISIRAVKD